MSAEKVRKKKPKCIKSLSNTPQLLLRRQIRMQLKRLKRLQLRSDEDEDGDGGEDDDDVDDEYYHFDEEEAFGNDNRDNKLVRSDQTKEDKGVFLNTTPTLNSSDTVLWNQAMLDLQKDILLERRLTQLEKLYNGKVPKRILESLSREMKEREMVKRLERKYGEKRVNSARRGGLCCKKSTVMILCAWVLLMSLVFVLVTLVVQMIVSHEAATRPLARWDGGGSDEMWCYECVDCGAGNGELRRCRYPRSMCTIRYMRQKHLTFKGCVERLDRRKEGCLYREEEIVCFCGKDRCNMNSQDFVKEKEMWWDGGGDLVSQRYSFETVSQEEFINAGVEIAETT